MLTSFGQLEGIAFENMQAKRGQLIGPRVPFMSAADGFQTVVGRIEILKP